MSYDFELYTAREHPLKPLDTSPGSNVSLDGPNRLEDEDIPDHYISIVGKKRELYRIHLEGSLSVEDQGRVDEWLSALVTATKGVLIDLQADTYTTTKKAGKLSATENATQGFGEMSFYFTDGEAFYENGFEEMLNCIAETMPEALPRRYGYYEPLQSKIEDGDCTHLIADFHKAPSLFMKSRTPFGHIFTSIPCRKTFERYHPKHFIRRNFLLGRVSFELRMKLFSDPSAMATLKELFGKLCVHLDVTYAEIVDGTRRGPSWFWHGLPETPPHTLCVGVEYQKVWPEITKTGHAVGDHHRIVSTDRFGNGPPCPPVELIAPDQGDRDRQGPPILAPTFPFDYSFDWKTYIW